MTPDATPDDTAAYLEIAPADGDLPRITTVFRQLAADDQPLVAYLISEDDTVRYILGAPGADQDTLERYCRRLLPDTYSRHPTTQPTIPHDDTTVAATIQGDPHRHNDWQTHLKPHHATTDNGTESPLGQLVDRLTSTDATIIYQAILHPLDSWEYLIPDRKHDLRLNDDTLGQKLTNLLLGIPDNPPTLESNQRRLDHLDQKDARHPIAITARLLATGPTAHQALNGLDGILHPISGDHYTVTTTHHTQPDTVTDLHTQLTTETPHTPPRLARWKRHIPYTSHRQPRLITDPKTAPHFCLLDPQSLTQHDTRHTTHQPPEHTATTRPNPQTLTTYQTDGLTLGRPQTVDGTVDDTPIALPPGLQTLHALIVGQTGAGKSTVIGRSILDNHQATQGADILIDPKGDGFPLELLQAHYHKHGTLENIYYFDCQQHLPALSVFDIRHDIQAGIDRTTAVIDTVDHYVDILEQLIGKDQYQDAIRSTDLVRYLLRACFDPVHGDDTFSHHDFLKTITRMQTTQEAPAVSDDDLATALQGVTATHRDSFQHVMHGVTTRVEEIVTDQRLTQIFNHTPTGDDPHFQFDHLLNENCLIILDTGGLRNQSQRVLTLVLLADLWAALRRRTQTQTNPPLVNLYIEEAAQVAASQILRDLLSQGRGFNISLTLATQFPTQLKDAQGTLDEVLNNIATIVTGNVPNDPDLAHRFATTTHPPKDIAARLRALNRGEWLATLPAPFLEDKPQPFHLQSTPIPPGHPESTQPLTALERDEFHAELDTHQQQLTDQLALDFTTPNTTPTPDTDHENETPVEIVSTTLPHTQRLPQCTDYDPHRHTIRCTHCDNHYAPTIQGLKRTIQCCHTLTNVDRDDIPTIAINLKLSPQEIQASDYTPKQLGFLQVVHNAQHQRYTTLEYDLTQDSMVRLREYVNLDTHQTQALIDDGLLRKDTDYPHTLYSVTQKGRQTINDTPREGLDHGDGHGDLGETSQHRRAVTLGTQYLEQEYVHDPNHPATRATSYHPIHDGKRLDAAALNDNSEVVVALEAERINNDLRDATPADYDKMAQCDPDEAIWIAMGRDGAHKIIDALNNPKDGDPRIQKTYATSTPPRQFNITQPGLTQMYTITTIHNQLN